MRKLKVFLTGGEGIGWALDDDLRQTQRALRALSDFIEFTDDMAQADVLHSVWPTSMVRYSEGELAGKRIITHMSNRPFEFSKNPIFSSVMFRVGHWIAQTTEAQRQLTFIGVESSLIPYTVDDKVFDVSGMTADDQARELERSKLGVPVGAFLIGNFHRDSEGSDLTKPKLVKGPDVFLAILQGLRQRHSNLCVLLAGPRRHWLRRQLTAYGIPYVFVGKVTESDDIRSNILDQRQLSQLYTLLDLYVVSSRAEGGPRTILEACAMKCPIISTPVGLALDILEPKSLYHQFDQAVGSIDRQIKDRFLRSTVDVQYERVLRQHTPKANEILFQKLYESLDSIPIYQARKTFLVTNKIRSSAVRQIWNKIVRRLKTRFLAPSSLFGTGLSISMWYKFKKPPYGGGNQFFLALRKALQKLGATVHVNRFAPEIDVHILNSTWFDTEQLSRYARQSSMRIIHRIDGPTCLVRGTSDRTTDDACFGLNNRFASATVLQSNWSFRKIVEMGYKPVAPTVVYNAADEAIFHDTGRSSFDRSNKIRLIATSWSDNPRKGGPVYKWLDEHLDWSRYEFTFVGRTTEKFTRIRHISAVPSQKLADILRQHDVYLTASQNDPCSNALIEALTCGLPALYLNDGGHPELVGHGGLPFNNKEEIIPQLDRLVENYELYQSLIAVPSIESTAQKYLEIARALLEQS